MERVVRILRWRIFVVPAVLNVAAVAVSIQPRHLNAAHTVSGPSCLNQPSTIPFWLLLSPSSPQSSSSVILQSSSGSCVLPNQVMLKGIPQESQRLLIIQPTSGAECVLSDENLTVDEAEILISCYTDKDRAEREINDMGSSFVTRALSTTADDTTTLTVAEGTSTSTITHNNTTSTIADDTTISIITDDDTTTSTIAGDTATSTTADDTTTSTEADDTITSTIADDTTTSTITYDTTTSKTADDTTTFTATDDTTISTVTPPPPQQQMTPPPPQKQMTPSPPR
ncbi:serine-rich adhesin for platelets-like [Penaeus chinensis]|uniref:serine-rich adhesin for platelets-like n=1 Tax=Penaeus chinensis TaxID=139456 RepID=UPI001FB72844|nr:serine-rich adhesin for platelets-like [Penaeus chinensis]